MPVRRVRRVIRKIDPWTVLKVTLVFNAILGLASVLGGVIFWSIFVNAGIPDKISEVAELLTLSFNPDGPTYFRIAVLLSVIWVVMSTGFATLGALLYNLISDVVGGIEVIVLEETLAPTTQVVRAAAPKQPRKVRHARFRRKKEPVTATGPIEIPAPVAPATTRPVAPKVAPAPKPVQPAATKPAGATKVEKPAPKVAPAPRPSPGAASPNGGGAEPATTPTTSDTTVGSS